MTATNFEYHHPTLVHQLIVGAAFLTYLFQADDSVWWFMKNRSSPHTLERALLIATLLIGIGAAICTHHTCCKANDAGVTTSASFCGPLGWARWSQYRDLSSWSSAKECESYVVEASGRESEIIVGYGYPPGGGEIGVC